MKRCFYQGVEGCYSYQASLKFSHTFNMIGKKDFREVFEGDYGIIALENSLIGSIYENYDLLHENGHFILEETYLKIDHCLLANHTDLSKIKRVFSHPKALEQCRVFFEKNPHIEKVVYFDTAGAARDVAKAKDPTLAALASLEAGKLYGLLPVAEKIQDFEENYTRFALISKQKQVILGANKTSLIFQLPHEVGALASILDAFAALKFNLTKIESRPLKRKPFEYLFYVDLECDDEKWLYDLPENFKVLGHYKKGVL